MKKSYRLDKFAFVEFRSPCLCNKIYFQTPLFRLVKNVCEKS